MTSYFASSRTDSRETGLERRKLEKALLGPELRVEAVVWWGLENQSDPPEQAQAGNTNLGAVRY